MPEALLIGWELDLKNRTFAHLWQFLSLYSILLKSARYFTQHRTYADPDSLHILTRTRGYFCDEWNFHLGKHLKASWDLFLLRISLRMSKRAFNCVKMLQRSSPQATRWVRCTNWIDTDLIQWTDTSWRTCWRCTSSTTVTWQHSACYKWRGTSNSCSN